MPVGQDASETRELQHVPFDIDAAGHVCFTELKLIETAKRSQPVAVVDRE
jgi:hypothetical protein